MDKYNCNELCLRAFEKETETSQVQFYADLRSEFNFVPLNELTIRMTWLLNERFGGHEEKLFGTFCIKNLMTKNNRLASVEFALKRQTSIGFAIHAGVMRWVEGWES